MGGGGGGVSEGDDPVDSVLYSTPSFTCPWHSQLRTSFTKRCSLIY